jgi:hypothetical protein
MFFYGAIAHSGQEPPHSHGFTITLRHAILGGTPLDEWSARRRDPYLTGHNNHKRETSMPSTGFEPAILASKRLQTHACWASWIHPTFVWSCFFEIHFNINPKLTPTSLPRTLHVFRLKYCLNLHLSPMQCVLQAAPFALFKKKHTSNIQL